MIKNNEQKSITEGRIAELLKGKSLAETNEDMSAIEKLYSINSFNAMIWKLEKEVQEYDNFKNGNLKILPAKSLEEFPTLLIQTRIALGMSQTELGEKLGIQPQQIQRYESNDYQSISFDRILEIANILGVCIQFENTVIIGEGPKFDLPSNIEEIDIINFEKNTKNSFSLIS